jgi:glucosylglycerate synthase
MPDSNPLPPEIAEALREHGPAEIVVGLPSYNNAATITAVAAAIRQGLAQAFPGRRAILVNTDSGSTDGTALQLAGLPATENLRLVQAILPAQDLDMPYHGIPGKGEGLHLTLRIAKQVGARLCLTLSPDLTSVAPEWIGMLGAPVVEQGFDFAVPLYARHKFDGSITNAIVRPLVRALYGRHMRQPMGGEHAFSAALCERYLAQNVWGTDMVRFGSDIWTTTQALCGSFNLCQVHLGPKNQSSVGAPPDLGIMLAQVLGALFEDMSRNAAIWQKVRGAQPIPIFGAEANGVPSAVTFDVRKLVDSFRLGLRNLQDLWGLVLPPATLLELKRLAAAPPEAFTIPDELWCRVVFDFALGYRMRTLNRSHLLGAFLPLHLGWLASYVREMQDASNAQSEQRLEQLCQTYEAQKPYLISRWRSPDRFNP